MSLRPLLLLFLPLLLGGCLVSVAKTIITAPIKAGEVIYDTATESQEEADIKRGRAALNHPTPTHLPIYPHTHHHTP